jgi:hypothetical protein
MQNRSGAPRLAETGQKRTFNVGVNVLNDERRPRPNQFDSGAMDAIAGYSIKLS